jgi:threonyl-tRNA synthetase
MENRENTQLFRNRHSLAHVLLMAIKKHYPEALPTIGPVIDTGFYYDVDFGAKKVTPEDLLVLEETMRTILKEHHEFKVENVSQEKALSLFSNNPFKVELISSIVDSNEGITLYHTGTDFFDLCEGPHVENTKEIPVDSFKLTSVAGAYWRGDEKKTDAHPYLRPCVLFKRRA